MVKFRMRFFGEPLEVIFSHPLNAEEDLLLAGKAFVSEVVEPGCQAAFIT